jgi:hypothetical protein
MHAARHVPEAPRQYSQRVHGEDSLSSCAYPQAVKKTIPMHALVVLTPFRNLLTYLHELQGDLRYDSLRKCRLQRPDSVRRAGCAGAAESVS